MSQNTSEKKHIVISENSESMHSMPEISLSGRISTDIKKHRYIKCSMCSKVIDQTKEKAVDHSYLCTGY